jgi:hypothetical protein
MPKQSRLDLGLLMPFPNPGVFVRIDPEVQKATCKFTEVNERIDGVERMCWHLGTERTGQEPDDLKRRRMYLRAALSEFASMEDAAAIDYRRLGYGKSPLIRDLDDPRLHVVRLLRHANVHLAVTHVSTSDRDAVWHGPDGPQEFKYTSMLAVDIEPSIHATDGAKYYSATNLAAMLEWLRNEQDRWGIQNVILRAAERYASLLQV